MYRPPAPPTSTSSRTPGVLVPVLLAAVLLAACTEGGGTSGGTAGTGQGGGPGRPAPSTVTAPGLAVQRVAGGLRNGWDIGFLPDGRVLLTERPGRLTVLEHVTDGGTETGPAATPVEADFADLHPRGEGGLMGLVIHPDFATSRRFTTCQTHWAGDRAVDVRLVTWELAADHRSARRVRDPLVGGLPLNPSGRHSGCRPTLAQDGYLLVGTGDTARPNVSQDRTLLGGKVLRIDLNTGGPAPGNPFLSSGNAAERLVWTYGHRNVQGVALQPGTGRAFSSEHGPDVDDEVNLLQPGANYGWDPSRGGTVTSYDENVPMTDKRRFPDAVEALWSSGRPTEAICAAAFLTGPRWGALDGALAVTALKGSKLLLFTLGPDAAVRTVAIPAELDDTHGRLRAARLGPDGALYVTTDNGQNDELLRITPR
jgi:glucose/arabinose dehydrogenase